MEPQQRTQTPAFAGDHIACIILAAGKGTRMRSRLPKVMHRLAGQPLVAHVLNTAATLKPERVSVVVAPGMPEVEAEAKKANAVTVIQPEQKGTGHAVQCARESLAGFEGIVVVLYGDTPMLSTETLRRLVGTLEDGKADVAVLGFHMPNPSGYGRLVLGAGETLKRIVEDRDASLRERQIMLCNSGVMAARANVLFTLLDDVKPNATNGEYYLTDVIAIARNHKKNCLMVQADGSEVEGINTRAQLIRMEADIQKRLREKVLEGGAMLIAPETVYLAADTEIGQDTVVHPFVVFGAGVKIGEGVEIKSYSHIEQAEIGAGAIVGPYARLRPGTKLADAVHIGNFVELKNAQVETGAKINHLSYVGDAEIGAGVNVGAGTITCNYDGQVKSRTVIKAGAFIGSNTSLVAPVEVGEGAIIGAGSVITEDVPADALAFERTPQTVKPDRARGMRERKSG